MADEARATGLYGGMILSVAALYTLGTLPSLATVTHQAMAVLAVVMLGHGLLLLLPLGIDIETHSGLPLIGYGVLMALNAAWLGGLTLDGVDTGTAALAVLVLWSGILIVAAEETAWRLP